MNLPATMKALVLTQDGYARAHSGTVLEAMEPYVALAELAVPAPGPSQVLIKVSLASINPSDVMFVKGMYGQPGRRAGEAGASTRRSRPPAAFRSPRACATRTARR